MSLGWCLTLEEVHDCIVQEGMVTNLWNKADFNTKTDTKAHPKTNLNKVLEAENLKLDDDERQIYTCRKLSYLMELYQKTAFQWTEEQFQEKLQKAYKRWYRIRFMRMKVG